MSNLILDLFTEFQTKMRAESALLMAKVMEIARTMPAPSADQATIERLEARLAALEKQPLQKPSVEKPICASGTITPQKRRHSGASVAVNVIESVEVKPEVIVPLETPNTAALVIGPLEAMTLEEEDDNDIEMSESSPKRPRQEVIEEDSEAAQVGESEEDTEAVQEDSEEAEEDGEAEEEAEAAQEEEAEDGEEDAEAEEAEEAEEEDAEAEEEDAEAEEEAEELTEFTYKGKKYFMDSECQVYGLDADGELNSDPIGIYDEKTRRITFHA